jgi:hypothetical protein
MTIDVDAAYALYEQRFSERFGDRPINAFVKLGKHMVQRLDRRAFEARLRRYLQIRDTCSEMLASGSTISDAVMMEFDEAAAWMCVRAPNLLEMFQGELGDPDVTAPRIRGQ